MPADNRLRLDDHQGVQNSGCNPIESGKQEPIESSEGDPLRCFSSQHIELMAQCHNLCLERSA